MPHRTKTPAPQTRSRRPGRATLRNSQAGARRLGRGRTQRPRSHCTKISIMKVRGRPAPHSNRPPTPRPDHTHEPARANPSPAQPASRRPVSPSTPEATHLSIGLSHLGAGKLNHRTALPRSLYGPAGLNRPPDALPARSSTATANWVVCVQAPEERRGKFEKVKKRAALRTASQQLASTILLHGQIHTSPASRNE